MIQPVTLVTILNSPVIKEQSCGPKLAFSKKKTCSRQFYPYYARIVLMLTKCYYAQNNVSIFYSGLMAWWSAKVAFYHRNFSRNVCEVVCNLCTWFEQYSTNLYIFHHLCSARLAGLHSAFNYHASDTSAHHNVIIHNYTFSTSCFVLMHMQVLSISHYSLHK